MKAAGDAVSSFLVISYVNHVATSPSKGDIMHERSGETETQLC